MKVCNCGECEFSVEGAECYRCGGCPEGGWDFGDDRKVFLCDQCAVEILPQMFADCLSKHTAMSLECQMIRFGEKLWKRYSMHSDERSQEFAMELNGLKKFCIVNGFIPNPNDEESES